MIITVISKKSKNLRFKCNFRFRKLWFLISFDHMDKKRTLSFDPIDPWRTFNYSLNYYLASFRYSKKVKFGNSKKNWLDDLYVEKYRKLAVKVCLFASKWRKNRKGKCRIVFFGFSKIHEHSDFEKAELQ